MTRGRASFELEQLVTLVTETSLESADESALRFVLGDFLACIAAESGTNERADTSPRYSAVGVDGVVSALTVRSCLGDRDDIDWRGLVHPGSIVWPVALALSADRDASGPALLAAAAAGYRATTALAQLLGPKHSARHHPTAVAGAFGAAITAGLLFELGRDELVAAAAHAISAAGGLGQASLERSRSMVFHRVAATSTGLHAARFAAQGFSGSRHVLDGPRGAIAILGAGAEAVDSRALTELDLAPSGISVRIYPVNGFVQAAVGLSADEGLRARDQESSAARDDASASGVDQIVVEIAPGAVALVSGEYGGDWWDVRSAVAAAYLSGDPFDLAMTPGARALRARVSVSAADLPVGYGRLRITGASAGGASLAGHAGAGESVHRDATGSATPPPGLDIGSQATSAMLAQKWNRLLGESGAAEQLHFEASAVLTEGGERARRVLEAVA